MVRFLKTAFVTLAFAGAAAMSQAATFNQITYAPAGSTVQVDVDLSGDYAGILGSFDILLNMQPGLFLLGALDKADGGSAPSYVAAALTGGGPVLIGSGLGGVSFPGPTGLPTQIRVTSNNVPTDNLRKFSLFFAGPPTAPDGLYSVAYQTSFTVATSGGVIEGAFPGRGIFNVRVGVPDDPPVVPLPAAGLLLLGALGALGAVRKRRNN